MFSPAGSGSKPATGRAAAVPQLQFMTPETRRTTLFFWTYLNNFEGEDANVSLAA